MIDTKREAAPRYHFTFSVSGPERYQLARRQTRIKFRRSLIVIGAQLQVPGRKSLVGIPNINNEVFDNAVASV
jgi:hypothetical protein